MVAVRAWVATGLLSACSSSATVTDPPDANVDGAEATVLQLCPVASNEACMSPPSYQRDVSPILDRYCNNCHSGLVDGGPWPLGGYQHVYDWKDLMVIDVLDCRIPAIVQGHPMPPADAPLPLPREPRDVVVTWLVCGAPDN
jgi:hypothetical protein